MAEKLTPDLLQDILAVALEDLPAKTVGSRCLATAIYAALKHGLSREQFLEVAEASYSRIEKLGGLEADAEAILGVPQKVAMN